MPRWDHSTDFCSTQCEVDALQTGCAAVPRWIWEARLLEQCRHQQRLAIHGGEFLGTPLFAAPQCRDEHGVCSVYCRCGQPDTVKTPGYLHSGPGYSHHWRHFEKLAR